MNRPDTRIRNHPVKGQTVVERVAFGLAGCQIEPRALSRRQTDKIGDRDRGVRVAQLAGEVTHAGREIRKNSVRLRKSWQRRQRGRPKYQISAKS